MNLGITHLIVFSMDDFTKQNYPEQLTLGLTYLFPMSS